MSDPINHALLVDVEASNPAPAEDAAPKSPDSTLRTVLQWLAIGASLSVVCVLLVLLMAGSSSSRPEQPRYVILMIPDGFGPAALTLGREMHPERHLVLDDIVLGGARTYSSDSMVTDSAASATAYASFQKTYNGAIGVDVDRLPIGTIMEAAKAKGYMTGCVVTSRVTHATPAAFTAHVVDRDLEDDIAEWQAERQSVDFLFGGGNRHFDKSLRPDGKDLKAHMAERGYNVMTDRAAFDAWAQSPSFPSLGLFANSHLEYDIDREQFSEQPSLAQMVSGVLKGLSKNAEGPEEKRKSFLMMVEGSRVDHGEHGNDPVAAGNDVLSYNEAVKVVLEFQAKHPENTLVISVADHETGGLTLGKEGVYAWFPEVVKAAKISGERLGYLILQEPDTRISALVQEYWNITLDATEEQEIRQIRNLPNPDPNAVVLLLADRLVKIISHQARIGWTTGAHTGVDVQVYARGPESIVKHLRGIRENTNIGLTIARFLSLDVEKETRRLRDSEESRLRVVLGDAGSAAQAQHALARAEEPYHAFYKQHQH